MVFLGLYVESVVSLGLSIMAAVLLFFRSSTCGRASPCQSRSGGGLAAAFGAAFARFSPAPGRWCFWAFF